MEIDVLILHGIPWRIFHGGFSHGVLVSSIGWRDKNGWEGDNKMSWTAMPRVLPPSFKHVNNLIFVPKQVWCGWYKNAQHHYSTRCNLLHVFCCPCMQPAWQALKGEGEIWALPLSFRTPATQATVYVMSTSRSGFGMPVMQSWKTSRRITRHHGEDASLCQIHHLLPDFSGFFVYLRV